MKKLVILTALLSVLSFSVMAQSSNGLEPVRHEEKWSDLTYSTVPVIKVLEGREGYVIIYLKNGAGTGTAVIPKAWVKGTPDNPRKLKFRDTKNPAESYMTIIKKGGEFHRVVLTLPIKKNNNIWGVVTNGTKLDTDKDTLEDLPLH